MSVKVMALVWDHYPRGGNELLVMLKLADHADHDGDRVFPAVSSIAKLSRVSDRTVQRALRTIEKRGWLVLVKETTGRPGEARRYRVPVERIPQGVESRVSKCHPSGGVTAEVVTGDKSRKTGDIAIAPKPSLTSTTKEPSVLGDSAAPHGKASLRDPDPSFQEAWAAYPQRSGNNPKLDAIKAWSARRKEGVKPELMLAGVTRYAAWCRATEKWGTEYVMRASTFFGPSKPYDQGFPVTQDVTKAVARSEPRCIWIPEGQPPSARCMSDGYGQAVSSMEIEGKKVLLRVCLKHHKPPVKDQEGPTGRLVHHPEVAAAIHRFKAFAEKNLVPA